MNKKNYNSCHSENMKEYFVQLLPIPSQAPYWTSKGTIGSFSWRALTTVYVPQLHNINETKKSYNEFHDYCRYKGGLGMLHLVLESIATDAKLKTIADDMYIVNTNLLMTGQEQKPFYDGLVYGMQQNTWYDSNALYLKGNAVYINFPIIKDKNLVFPFPISSIQWLKVFSQLASEMTKGGAASCVAIFLTMMMPNEKGEEPTYLPQEMGLPLIQGLSFNDLCHLL